MVPNAYTDRAMMIVVEGARTPAGAWVEERRNLEADYRSAFGEDPGRVTGIAIMTDTDNTGGTASAEFGDVVLQGSPKP
jgi:hypothetical protein